MTPKQERGGDSAINRRRLLHSLSVLGVTGLAEPTTGQTTHGQGLRYEHLTPLNQDACTRRDTETKTADALPVTLTIETPKKAIPELDSLVLVTLTVTNDGGITDTIGDVLGEDDRLYQPELELETNAGTITGLLPGDFIENANSERRQASGTGIETPWEPGREAVFGVTLAPDSQQDITVDATLTAAREEAATATESTTVNTTISVESAPCGSITPEQLACAAESRAMIAENVSAMVDRQSPYEFVKEQFANSMQDIAVGSQLMLMEAAVGHAVGTATGAIASETVGAATREVSEMVGERLWGVTSALTNPFGGLYEAGTEPVPDSDVGDDVGGTFVESRLPFFSDLLSRVDASYDRLIEEIQSDRGNYHRMSARITAAIADTARDEAMHWRNGNESAAQHLLATQLYMLTLENRSGSRVVSEVRDRYDEQTPDEPYQSVCIDADNVGLLANQRLTGYIGCPANPPLTGLWIELQRDQEQLAAAVQSLEEFFKGMSQQLGIYLDYLDEQDGADICTQVDDQPEQSDTDPTFTFVSCRRVEITGSFQENDRLSTTVMTPDTPDDFNGITAGPRDEDHFFLTIGDEVDAPFSGTIAFEFGTESAVYKEADGTIVNVEPDPTDGNGILYVAQVWGMDRADAWDPSAWKENPSLEACQTDLWDDGDDTDAVTQLHPDSEIRIQPQTDVLFEAATEGDYPQLIWEVDGEYAGDSLGPWQHRDYGYGQASYLRHMFDAEGVYEVTATVETDDGESTTTWTVTVTSDGHTAPQIETSTPTTETIMPTRTDPLELTVTDPDGALDRVVWWLGHADAILETADITGESATVTLPAAEVGECHRCPIIAWVCDTAGAIIEDTVWTIDRDADLTAPPS